MKEIVIISGKGGTGKTSITAAFAGLGPDKIMADCDVDAADLHLVLSPKVQEENDFISGELALIDPQTCTQCGLCQEKCRFEAISTDYQVKKENCEGCALCLHVCPAEAIKMEPRLCGQWFKSQTRFGPLIHATLGIGEENSGRLVTLLRKQAHDLAEKLGKDMVLVDGSPGIGCPVIASLTNTDLALVVTEPTISGVSDLKRVCSLTRHFKIKTLVLINKADLNPGLAEEIKTFCLAEEIPLIGCLPYATNFTQAQIKKQNIVEFDPQGIGKKVKEIWQEVEKHLD